MLKFFQAVKVGYEILEAILKVRAGEQAVVYPNVKGVRYEVSVKIAA